jgi:hypothetical protein
VGAVLALPAAAMAQALIGSAGQRYEVVDNHLTAVPQPRPVRRAPGSAPAAAPPARPKLDDDPA